MSNPSTAMSNHLRGPSKPNLQAARRIVYRLLIRYSHQEELTSELRELDELLRGNQS